jgi:hypothetical protein
MSNSDKRFPESIQCEVEPSGTVSLPSSSDWALCIQLKHKRNEPDDTGPFKKKKSERKEPPNPKDQQRGDEENLKMLLLEVAETLGLDEVLKFCLIYSDDFGGLRDALEKNDTITRSQRAQKLIQRAEAREKLPVLDKWLKKETRAKYDATLERLQKYE